MRLIRVTYITGTWSHERQIFYYQLYPQTLEDFLGLISWAQLRLHTEIHYQFSSHLLSIMCQALCWGQVLINIQRAEWGVNRVGFSEKRVSVLTVGYRKSWGSLEETRKTAWENHAQLRKSEESVILSFLSREQTGEYSSRKVRKHW